jgi:hypothetical protein
MSDLAPSNESIPRRATRVSLGITLVFSLAVLVGWPLAHLAPVFVGMLLQDSGPMTLRQGRSLFWATAVSLTSGFLIALTLYEFPPILVIVSCVLMFRLYVYLATSGAPLLFLLVSIIGTILMPVLVVIYPDLGLIAGLSMFLNFTVAVIVAWVVWFILPVSAPPPAGHASEPPSYEEAADMALTITIVMAPLFTAFLAFGWSSVLVIVYATLFASSYGSKASAEQGTRLMIANGVYGGVGMLICHELMVMVPTVGFMIAVMLLAVYIFASRLFRGGPTGAYWGSGLNGFMILLGGALLSDGTETSVSLLNRVWQIFLATGYVTFGFAIVEWVRDCKKRFGSYRWQSAESGSAAS